MRKKWKEEQLSGVMIILDFSRVELEVWMFLDGKRTVQKNDGMDGEKLNARNWISFEKRIWNYCKC